ncbi:MAG: ThuA domain-containing protein [Verrucomicrobia bacterium]|nr:ThuA domain-containing protein [Verrucomicrobiota bacterium]MDA1066704.1 ThuA domain-containing protein [Verrucomicrobiota bacterium]
MKKHTSTLFVSAISLITVLVLAAAPLQAQKKEVKPLKVLLITGGCCHAYATQQHILKKGIEARAHAIVDQVHTDDSTNTPPLAIYGNPNYAKGYDVVIHDECAAGMNDVATLKNILAPHQNGIPGVNLHCAMHSYRVGDHKVPSTAGTDDSLWFDYLGIQSSGHGPKEPIIIDFTNSKNVITKDMSGWATGPEELYNNVQVFPNAKGLATGSQHQPERKLKNGTVTSAQDTEAVVVWTNDYNGTRVFSTTIGHYDETVADDRYLDLVTRGLLWSCKKLNKSYLK